MPNVGSILRKDEDALIEWLTCKFWVPIPNLLCKNAIECYAAELHNHGQQFKEEMCRISLV